MKRIIFTAICIFGAISFSSCRSTSSHCGLAQNKKQIKQQTIIVADITVK